MRDGTLERKSGYNLAARIEDHSQTARRTAINSSADRMTKIVFIDLPGPAVRILPQAPVCDCLIDHFSKRILGNSRRKFAGAPCRAIRPVSLLNVPERPPVESDLLMNIAGSDLP